jgi:hypothetical protein
MKASDILVAFALAVTVLGIALPIGTLSADTTPMHDMHASDVNYRTGGIGSSEAEEMREAAKNYALEVVFVQKQKELEEFISDVKVQIQDAQKNTVLDVITDGPFLLVNLPNGKYVITADFNGVTKQQKVNVGAKKHQKIVFWWPILEQREEVETSDDSG